MRSTDLNVGGLGGEWRVGTMGGEEEVGCPGWGFNKASLHAAGTGALSYHLIIEGRWELVVIEVRWELVVIEGRWELMVIEGR